MTGLYEEVWFGGEILRDANASVVNATVSWIGSEVLRNTANTNATVAWVGSEVLRNTANTNSTLAWFGVEILCAIDSGQTFGDDGGVTILW